MTKFGLRNGVAKFFYSLELDHSKGMGILIKPSSPLRAEIVELKWEIYNITFKITISRGVRGIFK